MHPNNLSQQIIDQALEQRGALHPLADFNPAQAALLVINMQQFFLDRNPAAGSLCADNNRLATSIRLGGGQVAWLSTTFDHTDPAQWSHYFDKLLSSAQRDAHLSGLAQDSASWQLASDLRVADQDWRVPVCRFSALAPGASDLQARLREREIDTVLIAGIDTNISCESTGRDAMMLNLATIMVADCCAAASDAAHIAALENFQVSFGDVLTVDQVLAGIDQTVRINHAELSTG